MTSLRKFSIVLLVVAALAGFIATPAQAVTLTCSPPANPQVNVSFSMPCSAYGGVPAYGFQVSAGLPPGITQYASGSGITLQGTPTIAGTYNFTITVTDSVGNTSGAQPFQITVAAAGGGSGSVTLTSVSPSSLTAGVGYTLTITGTNFTTSSTVYFNGYLIYPSFVNSNTLDAAIPASDVTAGTLGVYVRDPSYGTSGTMYVTVTGSGGSGGITLSSLSPTSIATGSGQFTLTLFGSGFTSGQLVSFGANCTVNSTYQGSSELTATIPASCITVAGTYNVSVAGSNSVTFTVGSGGSGSLTLTSVSPTSIPTGTTTTLYCYGSNFTPNTQVHFNGLTLNGTYQSSTYLYVSLPGSYVTQGTLGVYLTDPTNGMSGTQYITVGSSGSSGIISLTQIQPSSLTANQQTQIILTGNNFTPNTVVNFNNNIIVPQYVSSQELIATIPAGDIISGSLPVYVTDSTNGTSSTQYVTVGGGGSSGTLSISSISPTSAAVNSGPITLNIYGSGFSSGVLLNFGTACTVNTTFISTNQLTAVINNNCLATAQTINVSVGASNTVSFTIGGSGSSGTITLSSLSPTTAPTGTQLTLYLYGSNFTPNTQVHFNGYTSAVTYQSSGTVYVTIPGGYVTSGNLAVYLTDPTYGTSNTLYVNGGGSGSSGIITLTQISPATLTPSTGVSLYLTGTNFTTSSTAYFNGTPVTTNYVNSTQLIASIPASLVTSGNLPVYVHDPSNGQSGTLYATVSGSGSSGGVTITSLSPSAAILNSPQVNMSIFGSGFTSGMLLNFGSICSVSTTFINSTEVQATLPSSCFTTAQTVNVTVGGSNAIQFVIGGGGSSGSISVTCSPTAGPTTLNTSYSQTCSATGGVAPYTWTVSNLPNGLTQSPYNGSSSVTISGTPTSSQSYAYTVLVTDSTSPTHLTGSQSITGTIGSGNTSYNITSISPTTIAAGSGQTNLQVFGTGFSSLSQVYLNGTGLGTTYVSNTQLYGLIPASLLASSQTVSITVLTSGTYTNAVTLTIGSGGSGSGGTISVNCTPGVGPQTINTVFSATCTATGGVQPYNWSIPSLPAYLTLSSTTGPSITLTGTPSTPGPYNYSVKVSDSSSPAQTGSLQIAGQVTSTSSNGGIVLTSLSPSSAALNSATVTLNVFGSGFNTASEVIFDGFAVATTYINAGQLTATIPSGLLTYSRAAQVTVTTSGVGTSNALSFIVGTNVVNQVTISCYPGVGPTSPNSYFSASCVVNGGTAPFNWSISAGSLPSGLVLNPNGVSASINGYTTLNGTYSYTLTVTDSSSPQNTYSVVYAGTTGAGSGSSSGVSITSLSPNAVTPGSPATTITINGSGFTTASNAYFNGNILATTFVNSGALTAIIPATLLIQAGTGSITVNTSGLVSNGLTFTIGTVTSTGITVSCTPDVGPTSTSSYTTTCTATGGKAPYTWSIVNGFLPQGLVLSNSNSSQVTISGLIFIAGQQTTLQYNYSIQATDSSTPIQTATYPFAGTISVTGVGTITSLNPISAPVGGSQFTLTVTGTGFQPGLSTVYWNGTPLATQYISTTQLSAVVYPALLTTIGTANISVSTGGYGVTSQVSFFVSGAGAVTVVPSSLSFVYALGGTFPSAQNLTVSDTIALTGFNVTVSALSNNITWLSVNPPSSTFPATLSVNAAPTGLPIGTYNGSITVTGIGVGTSVVIPVSLTVTGPPSMVTTPLSLTFTSATGSTAPTQTLQITSSDGNTVFPYSVKAVANNGGTWLTATPSSGQTPGTITVTASASSLAAGTYSGAISVTPTAGSSNSLSIPVTFTVTGPTNLSASPSSLTFNGTTGQSNPAAQSIAISATGGSTAVTYTVAAATASGGSWLSATASNGTTPGTISVSANLSGLAAGTYTGSVTITGSGASNSPLTVPVTLVVASPAPLVASPTSVTFNYQIGNSGPASQTVNLTGPNGTGSFNYTVTAATSSGGAWLSTSPTTGTTPGSISVTANASNLTAATYTGTLTISATGAGSVTVPVTLVVAAQAATLSVTPTTLTFNATAGGSAPAAQTVAVSTTNSVTANYTVTATSTGNWLAATASGTTPGSVSVSVNPNGLAVGQYTGSLSIASTGATNTPQTVSVTLNITSPPSITAAPQSLSFFVPGDGSTPAPQSVAIISTGGNTSFTASAVSQGGNWLTVSGGGQTPGSITATVNPTGLVPGGTYNGSITISAPGSNPNTLSIPVTLTLAQQGAVPLQAAPSVLYLSYTQGSGTDLQHIVVLNNGGGSMFYTVQGGPNGPPLGAPPSTCGNWLNVITPNGTATASAPGVVAFTVNPNGVNPQTCAGSISINTPIGQTVVPVYMAVSGGTQAILLSQTAMNFVAASNGSAPAPQTFQVLNPGSGTMPWSVSPTTLSGGSWLSVNPTSGNALSLSQPGSPINVTVNAQGLAAGTYYGTVQVTAGGVPNSSQSITVSLTVEPSGTNPPAQVTPNGVILTGTNGSSTTQMVNITNPGSSVLTYSAILATDDGQSWLTASPTSGSIAAGSTNAVTLTGALTNLGTGLRHGTLRLVFSDGTIQTVDVQLAVSGASSGTAVQACGSSNLAMEFLSPQQNFQASAQVAIPVQVLVQDCNGNALTSSNTGVDLLVGTSSTDIRLNYTGNGVWSGTWTPGTAASATTLTARAIELVGASVASGVVSANGAVGAALANAPPYVSAVVNAGSFMFPGLVAPGTMVSIFGSGLADGTQQVYSTPFPSTLQNAQFMIRGIPLPLFYASSGQVNAVVPIGLTADVRDQLVVVRDTTLSAPVDLLVADNAPGIFTVNSQGTGQAAALINGTAQIAAPVGSIPGANTAPATAGNTISIFLSGLGTVTNPPADGSPSTGTSLTTATPTASIGGVPAIVTYSGLAPGEVGLYQMNILVPAGTITGPAVPIFVSIGNENANFVTIAIQ